MEPPRKKPKTQTSLMSFIGGSNLRASTSTQIADDISVSQAGADATSTHVETMDSAKNSEGIARSTCNDVCCSSSVSYRPDSTDAKDTAKVSSLLCFKIFSFLINIIMFLNQYLSIRSLFHILDLQSK